MKTVSNKKPNSSRSADAENLSFWAHLRGKNPHMFAHHPPGKAFRDHVWEYKGLYFCKGCVMTFLGMFLGAILYPATGWFRGLGLIHTGMAFWALLLPAVVTALIPAPPPVKHAARLLLGVVVISAAILLFVTPSWWIRFFIVLTYLLVMIPLSRRRRQQNEALLKSGSGGR